MYVHVRFEKKKKIKHGSSLCESTLLHGIANII